MYIKVFMLKTFQLRSDFSHLTRVQCRPTTSLSETWPGRQGLVGGAGGVDPKAHARLHLPPKSLCLATPEMEAGRKPPSHPKAHAWLPTILFSLRTILAQTSTEISPPKPTIQPTSQFIMFVTLFI